MEPITLIATYVATKFFDQFIKDELYLRFKTFFCGKKTFINELEIIIYEVINDFAEKYPFEDTDKFPFYHSKQLFVALNKYVLFGENDELLTTQNFESDLSISTPTQNDLTEFYSLFEQKVKSHPKLKQLCKLFISDNYQERIYEISDRLTRLEDKIEEVLVNVVPVEMPIIKEGYISRNEQDNLRAILNKDNLLLLTGMSFCGKSQLAKKIASQQQMLEGYNYHNRNDLNDAERYLRNGNAKCVLVLEDPFGHDSISENPTNWRKVEELIQNLQPGNQLIITSRSEIIKSINKKNDLSACQLGSYAWYDLTNDDPTFLIEAWTDFCVRSEFPDKESILIRTFLEDAGTNELLQVGQLAYLSKVPKEKVLGKTTDQLLHLAKTDSRKLSNEIVDRGDDAIRVYSALSVTATTNIPVAINDLGYILSNDAFLYSFNQQDDSVITIKPLWDGDAEKPSLPVYGKDYSMTQAELRELEFLEARGFIEKSQSGFYFTHPTYLEAGRYLIINAQPSSLNLIEPIVQKSLANLNSQTAINASKQLGFLYRNATRTEIQVLTIQFSYSAFLRSIFPGVSDICLSFLIESINRLDETMTTSIRNKLRFAISANEIFWDGEVPFLFHSRFSWNFLSIPEKMPIELAAINEGKVISKSKLWQLLHWLQHPKTVELPNEKGIMQILNADEAFIRATAAFYLLKRNVSLEETTIKALFSDGHPAVVFEAVKGALYGSPHFNPYRMDVLRPYILDAMTKPVISFRANNLITTFGIDYGSESIKWHDIGEDEARIMWNLWAEMVTVFMNYAETDLRVSNPGRLWETFRVSIKYLNAEEGLKICQAHFSWIVKKLNAKVYPDSFEFGIMQYLLQITNENRSLRYNLFVSILAVSNTGFLVRSLSICMDFWEHLTEPEKDFILKLLKSNRDDQRWLEAICLTQFQIPSEMQQLLLGSVNTFKQPIDKCVSYFSERLLADCFSVFTGHPQPLWWLGTHHSGSEQWIPIMKWILKNHYAIGFDICLREIISDGVNGFSDDYWSDGFEIWEHMCQSFSDKKELAQRLILATSEVNFSDGPTKKLWDILICAYLKGDMMELVILILENIEALQQNGDLQDFLEPDFIDQYILPLLFTDLAIAKLYINMDKNENNETEIVTQKIDQIVLSASKHRIKIKFSFDVIDYLLTQFGEKFPNLQNLSVLENKIDVIGEEWLKRKDDHYELENWNI